MPRKILKSADLDAPALAGSRDFHKAVRQIARLAAEPEMETLARAWRASQGELLKTSVAEASFFGVQAAARLTDSEGLRLELRNARAGVKTVDPETMPRTLTPLKRQLQSAAIGRISEIRSAAIQAKAGLPPAQAHQALRLSREDAGKVFAGKPAGDLNALLNQAVTAIRQLLAAEEIDLARLIMPREPTLAGYNLAYRRPGRTPPAAEGSAATAAAAGPGDDRKRRHCHRPRRFQTGEGKVPGGRLMRRCPKRPNNRHLRCRRPTPARRSRGRQATLHSLYPPGAPESV